MKNDSCKKDLEKETLSHIYDLGNYVVSPSEMPDFIMQHKHLNHCWGVEITSAFFNESSARLKRVKNYPQDLIDKEDYKHKDDKKHLKVELATLMRDGKKVSTFKAIMSESPALDNYLSVIRDSVRRKSNNYRNYSSELNHINLIIDDEEAYFRSLDAKDFQRVMFRKGLYDLIMASQFREVFLLTTIKDKGKVYFPLKMLWFLSRWYKFNHMYNGYYNRPKRNVNQYLNYFMKHVFDCGVRDAYLLLGNRSFFFYYALSKMTFDKGKVNIFEEPDLIVPAEAQNFSEAIGDVIIETGFRDYMIEQEREFSYTMDFCMESKKNAN